MTALLCFVSFCCAGLRGAGLSGMMLRMADASPVKRLTESIPGRVAGWLLAVLWVYSLSGVDSNAYSTFPVCIVFAAVSLLVLLCFLLGCRVVRMSWLGWFSLAAGGYFLCRCLNSYALVESWGESALIVGAGVYYIAGVYVAQNRRYGSILWILGVALLLSMLVWWVAQQPWFCLEWTGRALHTPAGRNSIPKALLVYKNFAGFFFIAGGVALGAWAIWILRGWRRAFLCVFAGCSVALSFLCATRAPAFLAPIALLGLWVFDVLVQLYSGRKISAFSYIIGGILMVLVLVALYDFFFGRTISAFFDGTDSHGRYGIWAAVCEVLPHTPLWGYGASAVPWEVQPFFVAGNLANYAHNEYLQVWLDYGCLGLFLMLTIVVGHVVYGLRSVASDRITAERRALNSIALLLLVFSSAYAASDFPWHSFAIVAMTAFSCGVLASPFARSLDARKWRTREQAPVVPVLAQKRVGMLVILASGLLVWSAWMGMKFYPVWCAQWEYNRLSTEGNDKYAHQRRALIAELLPSYPDSALMDAYYMLPHYGSDWKERERLLKIALEANPKQLYVVRMLVDALIRQNKYADAEALMREKYPFDASRVFYLRNWPAYYTLNLLLWAREDLMHNRRETALSKMEYALAIQQWRKMRFEYGTGRTKLPWKQVGDTKPWLNDVVRACKCDIRLLKQLGVQPDDGWREPMKPGGRPSLYSSIVDKSRKK